MIRDLTEVDFTKTAVIVVDMQNDFLLPDAPFYVEMGAKMVPGLADFLCYCRGKGLPVIYTRHMYRPDGSDMGKYRGICPEYEGPTATVEGTTGVDVIDALAPHPEDHVIKKHCFNAFHGTELDVVLRSMGIETLILTGVNTDKCCFSTTRGAVDHGYDVLFMYDLTGNKDLSDRGYGVVSAEEVHRIFVTEIAAASAKVITSHELQAYMDQVIS